MNYKNKKYNECKFCGDYSGKYELCKECYYLSKEQYIIKNEAEKWIKNVRKGNEYKFYDESKSYTLKKDLMNEHEMRLFKIIKSKLNSKYEITPQVNLQTIIETNNHTRNDELFRNIDFMLFHTDKYIPFLAIELNGQQHYTNEYIKERDKSVKIILEKVNIPLLSIEIKDLKKLSDNYIYAIIKKIIKYLNPGFFEKLFKKQINKMDLSWAQKLIKQTKE